MPLVRLPGTPQEPISLEDAKIHLRVDYPEEDDLIRANLKAAREWIERRCEIAIVQQDWEYRTATFPAAYDFPKPPTAGFSGVWYIDTDGNEQAVDPDAYLFIEGGEDAPSQIIRVGELPADLARRPDAVRIRFSTGYPESDQSPPVHGEFVPEDLKQAIRALASSYYETRSSVILSPVRQELQETPQSVSDLIAPYITPRL